MTLHDVNCKVMASTSKVQSYCSHSLYCIHKLLDSYRSVVLVQVLSSLVPRFSVQLFFARSKISSQRAWENSPRELRQLRDVGCVVLLNRITRDVYEQRCLYVAAMHTKVRRPYQRPKTGPLFEETEC